MDKIETFLNAKNLSEGTKRNYRSSIRNFLDFMFKRDREKTVKEGVQKKRGEYDEWKDQYPKLVERYFTKIKDFRQEVIEEAKSNNHFVDPYKETGDKIFMDIRDWLVHMREEEEKAESTINQDLSRIKNFMQFYAKEYKYTIQQGDWKRLSDFAGEKKTETDDRKPTKEELRKILNNMTLQMRAIVYVLASSGMRIGELLSLRKSDVSLEEEVPTIHIREEVSEKNDQDRYTFITPEAKEVLEDWIHYKETEYQKRGKGNREEVDEEDLFPFHRSTPWKAWNRALEKAGLEERDEDTNRRTLHIHSLRKFFRTELGKEVPIDVVEALMGHKGYLTDAYRKYSREELKSMYKGGMDALIVSKAEEKIKEVEEEMKEQAKKVERLRQRLDKRNGRIRELEKKLEEKEKEKKEREDKVEKLSKQVQALAEKVEEIAEEDK